MIKCDGLAAIIQCSTSAINVIISTSAAMPSLLAYHGLAVLVLHEHQDKQA